MEMTDSAVIEQIRGGNIDKFEIIIDRYSAKIHSYIRARLFDKEEADDIVQLSFVRFYRALSQYDRSKPLYPYLLQIARNELYMYFRKNKITVPFNEDIAQLPDEESHTEDVEEIMNGLKPDHKNALLWFAEGYSYKEISKKLGKPLNSVRTLIHRARLFVQKKYS